MSSTFAFQSSSQAPQGGCFPKSCSVDPQKQIFPGLCLLLRLPRTKEPTGNPSDHQEVECVSSFQGTLFLREKRDTQPETHHFGSRTKHIRLELVHFSLGRLPLQPPRSSGGGLAEASAHVSPATGCCPESTKGEMTKYQRVVFVLFPFIHMSGSSFF